MSTEQLQLHQTIHTGTFDYLNVMIEMGLQTAYANLAGLIVRKTFRWIPFCTEVNKLFAPINGIVQAVCTDVSIEPAAPQTKKLLKEKTMVM